jgi:hypothetical protein
MPGGDRTGPMGMGPMTGRRAGYCAGFAVPGFMNPGFGFGGGGWGRGGGRGRGRRNLFYATGLTGWQRAAMGWPAGGFVGPNAAPFIGTPPTKEQEMELLHRQAEMLQSQLDEVKQRLAELETANAAK